MDEAVRRCTGPTFVQTYFDLAWSAGFGNGSDFGGKLAGKRDERSHVGPVEMCEALAHLGEDADYVGVHGGTQETADEEALAAALVLFNRSSCMPILFTLM